MAAACASVGRSGVRLRIYPRHPGVWLPEADPDADVHVKHGTLTGDAFSRTGDHLLIELYTT